jgi:hypothetical protein
MTAPPSGTDRLTTSANSRLNCRAAIGPTKEKRNEQRMSELQQVATAGIYALPRRTRTNGTVPERTTRTTIPMTAGVSITPNSFSANDRLSFCTKQPPQATRPLRHLLTMHLPAARGLRFRTSAARIAESSASRRPSGRTDGPRCLAPSWRGPRRCSPAARGSRGWL